MLVFVSLLGLGLAGLLVLHFGTVLAQSPVAADGTHAWPGSGRSSTLPPPPQFLFLPATLNLFGRDPFPQSRPQNAFGVQLYGNETPSRVYSETERLGAGWIRLPIYWSQIEPANTTPEFYAWGPWDAFLSYANENHLNVILTFSGNPEWAATFPAGRIDRVDMSELEEFFTAMVERYDGDGYQDAPGSPVVRYYEIYNEPDNADVLHAEAGWGNWGHYGAEYADLLQHVHKAVHRADDQALIMLGGLAYDWFEEDGGPFVREFLDDVLNAWGGRYFDILAFHYYPAFDYNWSDYGPGIIGKASYLQRRMQWHHVYKPLLSSESGWHSNFDSSPTIQSQQVVKIMARSVVFGLEATIWFRLTDSANYPYYNGLLDLDMRPKPAYAAYQTVVAQLADLQYDRPLHWFETHSTEIEGYRYIAPDDQVATDVTVVWANDGITHTMAVQADRLMTLDMYGNGSSVEDFADGQLDGQTTLQIGPDPLYYFEVHR